MATLGAAQGGLQYDAMHAGTHPSPDAAVPSPTSAAEPAQGTAEPTGPITITDPLLATPPPLPAGTPGVLLAPASPQPEPRMEDGPQLLIGSHAGIAKAAAAPAAAHAGGDGWLALGELQLLGAGDLPGEGLRLARSRSP